MTGSRPLNVLPLRLGAVLRHMENAQMSRPFFSFRIQELEAEFKDRGQDVEFLRALLHELSFRSNPKASQLKLLAEKALASAQRPSPSSTRSSVPPSLPQTKSRLREVSDPYPPPPPPQIVPPIIGETPGHVPSNPRASNEPCAILDAWTALEVLSPQTFRRPEDLAGGDRQAVAWLDRDRLPWEGGGEKARPNTRLFYQLVLGTVEVETALNQLLTRYGDSRVERPSKREEAILAVVTLDREGRLVEEPAVAMSSFGWGVPRALRGDLATLADWRIAAKPLIEGLDEILRRTPKKEEEEVPSLDAVTIITAHEWLSASLGLASELVNPPRFLIRVYEYYKNPDPPEPLLLNSFFLNDLSAARTLFAEGRATPNLRRYLGCDIPPTRQDLLHDTSALEAAVAPEMFPPARWPGPGRHPLVLLQQAAVNLSFRKLNNEGILAVNGPPGTGKTTLLRDLVAAVVTARADAMSAFNDPAEAFIHSGEKLRAGQAWLHLYRLDQKLKGFEMLVASSNNKAVENVSAELPARKSVAEDADIRYLSTVSDELLQGETWGLIAAVLGNATNRSRFKKTFWWDSDVGLSTYLAEVAGTPQLIDKLDPKTGEKETRPPRIVTMEDHPKNHADALRRWQDARKVFKKAIERSRKLLAELATVRETAMKLPLLAKEEADAYAAETAALDVETIARTTVQRVNAHLTEVQRLLSGIEKRLADHDLAVPGFLTRLFQTRRAREWSAERRPLAEVHEQTRRSSSLASQAVSTAEEALRDAANRRQTAERQRTQAADRHTAARNRVASVRERLGNRFIDAAFFRLERTEQHKTAPWLDEAQQRVRDDVFVAAINLHKAFIDAAAKPLRHNLGVLMNTFGGRALPTAEKRALAQDLWSSLFLIVPLVSTTFASVERMLGEMPHEGIGWLFVDEAGQALPQAAVGALMRSRRAVVVGDPVQIEPIVILPETLTYAICRYFGVDPDRYNAPNASAQTLSDAATSYYAEFQGKNGSRNVGVPLLVHRRCSEPMFGISNAVAYDRLMVSAKKIGYSRIGEILGPSAWLDVRGCAEEKWCPEEGEVVLSLLRRLGEAEVIPDLYIVTPFLVVADNLRKLVRSVIPTSWTDDPWKWTSERIGTVHTVQGREAEAVIFVLGAPAPHQTGARGWAGRFPNLLNVAVTRAKERIYVVGNRSLWRDAGLFRELDERLTNRVPEAFPEDLAPDGK